MASARLAGMLGPKIDRGCTMRVLVAAASKYGATGEIAAAIAETLDAEGIEPDLRRVEDVDEVGGYDAVVLGSAIYMGRWLKQARGLVDAHAAELAERPTWLFSSGPLGDPPKPAGDNAASVDELVRRIAAREHRVFPGRLEKSRLHFSDRAVATAIHAPDGDFRYWEEIASWARRIARELRSRPA
jgi:menaquinone-dependent protoporphyrinogen oxidase